LAQKALLIYAEQGRGDTFQFIRFLALLGQRGARVVFECPPDLVKLLRGLEGIDCLLPQGTPLPPVDLQVPLLSLPGLLGTTLDSVPSRVPYLKADPSLVDRWRDRLAGMQGRKVGISWQGNPHNRNDRARSVPLAAFVPLAHVPGVVLVNLQRGFGSEQLAELAGKAEIVDLLDQAQESGDAWVDSAALIAALDLVITVDTAVANLAGALGVPVWLALPFTPDWRWLLDREDSPWYPTMCLFRQTRPGDWPEVFARLASRLQAPLK
jgi:hypothetical protein